ncbi:MAG: hypothetical protein JNL79_39165 [Myxococcales bacterium]|nr:hypothetical protein [Myxococcales bacterium]
MQRRLAWLSAIALLGCGGTETVSSDDASVDSATVDTATSDSATSDSAAADSVTSDSVTSDSADVGKDTAVDVADIGACRPFWCGCGSCVAADIVCTRSSAGCPLGCPAGPCPEMEKAGLCTGEGDRCVRNGIGGEIACLGDGDCPPGKCCSGTFTPPKVGRCGACP